ncbi:MULTISPECIES: M56 family metallopeptidase [Kitasatospora]|uniref:M56 family metallopeptidase n=1 Tax=Kitasatospora cathayae TaxID=3004092 RepID=A0ABY7Q0Y3_9ACTN|nr:M56 family metallopeptidase [Kitasatospora sp. HUAS 3-15]WBP86300.1 M56 family metallopeptidase [Kitasatospora sp. HUAS 3-15]
MRVAVYLPLLFPLLAALVARPVGEKLPPRLATWLLTVGALVLAAGSTAVLGMLAITGLIRIPFLARLAQDHWSPYAAQHHDPASFSVAVLAGVLLTAAAVLAGRMLWRRSRTLAQAAREAACLPGRDQLVVVDDPAAEAYAIPGLPGRIVVSTGMLDALDPAEHQILLAHERAHLAHHHYLFVALAQFAAAANPLLRPLATTVTFTVERWADESAAAAVGDRERVARTVGKAALAARRTRARNRIPAAALGLLGRLGRLRPNTLGPVPRRVTALLVPAPRRHIWSAAALSGLAAATALCAAEAAHDLEALLELAKHAATGS